MGARFSSVCAGTKFSAWHGGVASRKSCSRGVGGACVREGAGGVAVGRRKRESVARKAGMRRRSV